MDFPSFLDLFPGLGTLLASSPQIAIARLALISLGILLVYLGYKGVLEALLMVPMGLGMAAVNAAVLFLPDGRHGTLFVDPLAATPTQVNDALQIYFLQPIYTFTFSNGLIACLVFMGIGVLLDIQYLLARPLESMFLALCAELGTVLTFPIAVAIGLSPNDAASIAMVGGADGPMVLFTSLILSRNLFVPITIVAYLYLGLTYGGYPYLIKLLIPKHLRVKAVPPSAHKIDISPVQKQLFIVVACVVLCFIFPVAAPLFVSLFLGMAIRQAELTHFTRLIQETVLYGATLFLGFLLGVLCEANTILNPEIFVLLLLGILALLLSGLGGIAGGYLLYLFKRGQYNPTIGIAGVSCVPTTVKVAQKAVAEYSPSTIIIQEALGANISGVITSATLAGIYITVLPLLTK